MRLVYVCVLLSCIIMGLASTAQAAVASKLKNFNVEHVPNQAIIVPSHNMLATSLTSRVQSLGGLIKHQFRTSGAYVVEFNGLAATDFQALLLDLADDPAVAAIEANTILRMDVIPNDPRFSELYGLHNTGQSNGSVGADIKAVQAWDVTTGSRDVVVAVIDTGINYLHPDIAPNYWNNPGEVGLDENGQDKRTNGIDDDGNGFIDDWRGWDFVNDDNDPMDDNSSYHGTHCAGTIGAAGNDGVGVVGVNWEVSLVGLKFLSAAGSGTLDGAVRAIEYANTLGVTMTSNSWGGGGYSQVMADAIAEAEAKGILFIAAAGNSGSNNDVNPHFPSSYEHDIVVSVAASDRNDNLASFSCYGATSVDLAAPGVDILSTSTRDTFKVLSGTSMATPHVAGAAALIKAAIPDITADKIKMRLMFGADIVAATQTRVLSGGRLNVANAVEQDTIAPNAVHIAAAEAVSRSSVSLVWTAAGDDGEEGVASSYEVRYANEPIVSEDAWQAATRAVVSRTFDAETNTWTAVIAGLPLNYAGHAAVRAYDNVGNIGAISGSQEIAVIPVRVLAANPAETLDDVIAEGTWGVEAVAGANGNAFSDSPGGNTKENANDSLILPAITLAAEASPALSLNVKVDLERGYDILYVEAKVGESETWIKLKEYTGSIAWKNDLIDLAPVLAGNDTDLQIRFRLKTDSTVNYDGVYIDDIAVIANQ